MMLDNGCVQSHLKVLNLALTYDNSFNSYTSRISKSKGTSYKIAFNFVYLNCHTAKLKKT